MEVRHKTNTENFKVLFRPTNCILSFFLSNSCWNVTVPNRECQSILTLYLISNVSYKTESISAYRTILCSSLIIELKDIIQH